MYEGNTLNNKSNMQFLVIFDTDNRLVEFFLHCQQSYEVGFSIDSIILKI